MRVNKPACKSPQTRRTRPASFAEGARGSHGSHVSHLLSCHRIAFRVNEVGFHFRALPRISNACSTVVRFLRLTFCVGWWKYRSHVCTLHRSGQGNVITSTEIVSRLGVHEVPEPRPEVDQPEAICQYLWCRRIGQICMNSRSMARGTCSKLSLTGESIQLLEMSKMRSMIASSHQGSPNCGRACPWFS